MIVGGAQETALVAAARMDRSRFDCELLSGEETGAEGSLHEEIRRLRVRHHLEPALIRAIRPVKDLVALIRLTHFMRSGRYDVVHTHTSKAGILGRIAARLAGVRTVVHTVHGLPFTPGQSRVTFWTYLWIERLCAWLSDALVVVATQDAEESRRLGIGRPGQHHLIRSGVDIEAFQNVPMTREAARARLGVPEDAFVIGTVGRLSAQKAPLDLLRAFILHLEQVPNSRLVFVGDGPMREEVEHFVREAGLQSRVLQLGLRHDVPELLRAFDLFALSSHWEGLPRVFPQALAAGLPIVATDVAGARDIISPGRNGWLVPVGDAEVMAERMTQLATDPALRASMASVAIDDAKPFSATEMVARLERLYLELVVRH